jgi:hypothetical protein
LDRASCRSLTVASVVHPPCTKALVPHTWPLVKAIFHLARLSHITAGAQSISSMAFITRFHILELLRLQSSAHAIETMAPRTMPSPIELVVSAGSGGPVQESDLEAGTTSCDMKDIEAMGIEQVYYRRYKTMAMLAFNSTVVVAWQNTLATMGFILYNGGTGGIFFSYIIATIGYALVFVSLAELSSWSVDGHFHIMHH